MNTERTLDQIAIKVKPVRLTRGLNKTNSTFAHIPFELGVNSVKLFLEIETKTIHKNYSQKLKLALI